jgi:hypothetical protein
MQMQTTQTQMRAAQRASSDVSTIAAGVANMSKSATSVSKYVGDLSRARQFRHFVFRHPVKAYFRAGSVAFGGVFVANTASGLLMREPPISPYTHPQSFAWLNLCKCTYFAFAWPAIPFMLLDGEQRRDLCVVGRATKRASDDAWNFYMRDD